MRGARLGAAVLGGCALVLAYGAGRRQGDHAPSATAASPAVAAPRPIIVERAGAALTRDDLRDVVREELTHQLAARPSSAVPEAAPPAEEAAEWAGEHERRAAALVSARQVVETGLGDGIWSTSDREALRQQLPLLGERETHEVLSPLFRAINAQRLQLDGPPI